VILTTLQSTAPLLLATAVGLFPARPATASVTELRYREAWGYAVVVPVRVNGQGPFEFVLDTGSSHSAVREGFARRLGLVSSAGATVVTVAGSTPAGSAHIDRLELGPLAVHDVDASVAPLPALLEGESDSIVGLLGQSALRGLDFTLDHRHRRIVFEDDGDRSGVVVPIETIDGAPTVRAQVGCGGDPVRLTLDSGVAYPLLFAQRSLPLEPNEWMDARTNAGDIRLRAGRLKALCIGAARLESLAYALHSGADAAGRAQDGLLPTRLFAHVRFEPSKGIVRLKPR